MSQQSSSKNFSRTSFDWSPQIPVFLIFTLALPPRSSLLLKTDDILPQPCSPVQSWYLIAASLCFNGGSKGTSVHRTGRRMCWLFFVPPDSNLAACVKMRYRKAKSTAAYMAAHPATKCCWCCETSSQFPSTTPTTFKELWGSSQFKFRKDVSDFN